MFQSLLIYYWGFAPSWSTSVGGDGQLGTSEVKTFGQPLFFPTNEEGTVIETIFYRVFVSYAGRR